MVLLTAVASHNSGPRASAPVQELTDEARRLEALGFDVLSYPQMLNGDVFPALMEIARATTSAGLMTRIVGAASRSPVMIASGAAWVDHASGGRFALGLGAGVVIENQQYLGVSVPKSFSHMRDTVTIIRALWGDDLPGVTREANGWVAYSGSVLQVERATVDLLPAHRVPILLAAAGPRMLRLAGAMADGVILELTTPAYVRWARSVIGEGAAAAGRTLPADFLICVQGSHYDSRLPDTHPYAKDRLYFTMSHCVFPEFRAIWEHCDLAEEAKAVSDAATAGDIDRAEDLVKTLIFPTLGIDRADPDSFWRWAEGHVVAGATMLALPATIETTMQVRIQDIKAAFPH